jgi:nucleotide-binding universal stress UspA family protein
MLSIKTSLSPVDFSECAEHALQYALAFAKAYGAELHLLHVVEPVPYGAGAEGFEVNLVDDMRKFGTERLTALTERVQSQHAQVVSQLATGAAFVEIVRYAREHDADLIVIGTHGRTGMSHLLIGSCAERVVRKASCPVLTVKHPSHDFVMP